MTIQGPLGNIWLRCSKGILVYDGYNYKLIKNKAVFFNDKKKNRVQDMLTDSDGNIWITSASGLLTKYNASTGLFEDMSSLLAEKDHVNNIFSKGKSIWLASKSGNIYRYTDSKISRVITIPHINPPLKNIFDIELVGNKQLYISTTDGEIFNYDLKTKQLTKLTGSFNNYPGNIVLTADNSSNRLWIGTEIHGLFVYNTTSKQFVQDIFFKKKKFNINKEMFITLFCDSHGYIWGGTDGGGLYKINSNTGSIDLFTKQDTNEFSLNSNSVLNISEDSHKNIWVTTNYGSLFVLPNANINIKYHTGSENNTPLRILSIYKSSIGDLFIGTDGAGLTKIVNNPDGTTNATQYFNNLPRDKGFYVQSITEDEHANIWLGTYRNGLWCFNTKNNTLRKKISIYNSKEQEATDVRTVFKDSKGRIWIGSNISVSIFTDDLRPIASFENNKNGLKGSNTESILEDKNGTIWLALYNGGLFQFNENTVDIKQSMFTKYSSYENNDIFSAKSMVLGEPNEIYLINHNGKLLKFNTTDKTYSNFEHIESINEQIFSSIIKENDQILWIGSTNNGISRLDIKKSTLKTFNTTDGFQNNMFLSTSSFKDKEGLLYFGGIKGINYFNPKHLRKKVSKAILRINDIEILNQPVDSLIPSQVTTGIHNIESLKLKYNQSSFSFRFSAIDNILNPKYYYAYRLKGFDDKWITNHSERVAIYTNIPSGDYTFEVKAGTKKNTWDIPTKQINITIEQPIWNKPLAYIIYLFIMALIAYGIRRWYLLRKKLFLEKIDHKKENELHEIKMNFFTKMSHEIQTPITLILGPIDDMLKRAEQNGNLLLKQRLNIISNNTKRLSKIARELTLVRNKELDKLRLIVNKNNLYKDIENISLSFKELARQKQIDFAINCPKNLSEAWYDKEKIEHIIYNLLSNAFKFTPKEGYIQLNVIPIDFKKAIRLSVVDSGPGIPQKELNTIFELFYQSKAGKKNKGSGIGLALTKELVDLHKGSIEVESTPGKGTIFTITLPIKEEAYTESERITTNTFEEPNVIDTVLENELSIEPNGSLNTTKKTILIVEDNYDLQAFLKDLLFNQYNIILAENGEEGYLYAKNNFPDLIISDIIMPKMDGIKMCDKLQDDKLTKHIPIILLTAKNSTHSKIHGLQSGAIEYINKPFNTKELLLKIKNIISSKEHIISKYRKEMISNPKIKQKKSQDEIFLENMMSYITLNLNDTNFKVEGLAGFLNMSYSSLYRKCLELTGQSIVDFVRSLRLKRAAILITKYGYSISEAAFMNGFNDPKYFSKCFKKQFKKTPKEFKNEAVKTDIPSYLKKHAIKSLDL
ncbi:ATP-binding protein [Flavivirga spongiicola]|uniref:histidine kinase n=1 Tax=Flavivirga spongiicola TaxID=421621 RepID=A0ABU7XX69_9FLAO|nr:ATP-binding protein [Flavivirga sp. MEBiC05379]MDO5980367.1 ATP-binding protein [Flavivirga sp. MEBiC05379]